MNIFGIPISFFMVAYVVAIVIAFAILHALDVLHEVVLPKWMHRDTFGLAMILVATYFMILFGIAGLILSMIFSEDLAFTFALCVGFTSLLRREDGTSVWV